MLWNGIWGLLVMGGSGGGKGVLFLCGFFLAGLFGWCGFFFFEALWLGLMWCFGAVVMVGFID